MDCDIRLIAQCAVRATLHEAAATPKPGLVCADCCGAHDDMDITTLVASAVNLQPYFADCASTGATFFAQKPTETLEHLRERGIQAEQTMLTVTGGVNTHKGLIFLLGLLCAAAGHCLKNSPTRNLSGQAAGICTQAAAYAEGITTKDFTTREGLHPLSAGETLFLRHGVTGARGEAERGFPNVLHVLPQFRWWLTQGSLNDAAVNTLLLLMQHVDDTNVLWRCGQEGVALMRGRAGAALNLGGIFTAQGRDAIHTFGKECKAKRLSPGGCADLLTLVIFLHLIENSGKV